MAKGNLFLGTASRSVGDVTLMRRNGQQVARARVRKIANPRSHGQAAQRMLTAAITRFYSPFAGALEKSWEGKNKMDSYAAYLKQAHKRGKAMKFAVPKDYGFAPIPVQVSAGTIPSVALSYNSQADAGFILECGFTAPSESVTFAAFSQAMIAKYGLEDGDQVTFIWALNDVEAEEGYIPQYHRIWLDVTDTTPLSSSLLGGLNFEADAEGNLVISEDNDAIAGMAVIISHYDNGVWRRSTQNFVVAPGDSVFYGDAKFNEYVGTWMDGTSTPVSNVYLNGSHPDRVTVKLNGTSYTLTGSHLKTIGDKKYVYFSTEEGKDIYFKNSNDRSDQFGMWYDDRLVGLSSLVGSWGAAAPATMPANSVLVEIDGTYSASYTAAIAGALEKFAIENGWTITGAAAGFAANA